MAGNIQYYNLIGGLNTVQGIGTLNQSPRKTESPEMKNVEYYKLGGIVSMNGNTQFGNTLENPISLGYEYIQGNNKYLMVCDTSGKVWEYDRITNQFVNIYTFPTATERHSIAAFNNGIIISNGVDDLVYYNKNRHQLLDGNITVTSGNRDVTGTGTSFTTQLHTGDYVSFGDSSVTHIIETITDDTRLTLEDPVGSDYIDVGIYLDELSLCKAVYTNSKDENINKTVRGLALNTYNGRIFVGSNDGVLYYSAVGDIHGWDLQLGAGAIPQFYNDNSDFTALALWDKYLVICKRERSYLLNGNDADESLWTIEPYSPYTCDSQQSWIDINNGLYIYSREAGGIYPMLQRTIYSPNYQGTEASVKIKDSFNYINTARYDYIFPVYHPKKRYLMFYIPMLTGIGSNSCYIFDLQTKSWLYREVTQEVTIAFQYNDEVYIGTKDGKILKEFSGNSFDDKPIEWYWKSPWFSFGRGTDFLSTREYRLNLSSESGNNFFTRVRRDGKSVYKQRRVTNNTNRFIGLDWDIGYNKDDKNSSYISLITSYQVTDGSENFYTSKAGESSSVCTNAKLFEDEELTTPAGYAGINTQLVPVPNGTGDIAERIIYTGYRWNYNTAEYIRYSNGTDYLWIDWNVSKPMKGITCKISKKSSSTVKLWAYNVGYFVTSYASHSGSRGKLIYLYPSDTSYGHYSFGWAFKGRDASGNLLPYVQILTAPTNDINAINQYYVAGAPNQTLAIGPTSRNPSYDIYEGTDENTGSDLSQAMETVITNVVDNGDGTYNITTPEGTFSNMGNPVDDGNTITNVCYTSTPTLSNGLAIYSNEDLTNQYATGNSNTTILITSNNKTVTPMLVGNYYYFGYNYYDRVVTNYTYTGVTAQVNNPSVYPIPSLTEDYDYTQTITDTVWANQEGTEGDNWIIDRNIIKRFPLPDQFFNTVQLEFYGNTIEQQITLNGFEINGIELEEVPY